MKLIHKHSLAKSANVCKHLTQGNKNRPHYHMFNITSMALIFLDALGHISTIIVIVVTITTIFLCLRGFVPVLIRLGNGLWRRKIAVFAKGDSSISFQDLLYDSGLFNKKNIVKITNEADLGKAECSDIFLIYWPDWESEMEKILSKKKDGTALIIYCPQSNPPTRIPDTMMQKLGQHRNVVVNNFRGRLINDIVISMITSGYEKK